MTTVLRPEMKKVLLITLLKALSGIVFLVILLLILEFSVGLEVFAEMFMFFGIDLTGSYTLQWGIVLALSIGVLYVLSAYYSISSQKYEFYDDKMMHHSTFLLMFKTTKPISYQNISKVDFYNKGLFDSIFHTGSIFLDLSSLGEPNLVMRYVDNPSEAANTIQEILRSYQLKTQAKYTENYRIKGILERGGL